MALGQGFEACRVCDALEGLAQVREAFLSAETTRLVETLHAIHLAPRAGGIPDGVQPPET